MNQAVSNSSILNPGGLPNHQSILQSAGSGPALTLKRASVIIGRLYTFRYYVGTRRTRKSVAAKRGRRSDKALIKLRDLLDHRPVGS